MPDPTITDPDALMRVEQAEAAVSLTPEQLRVQEMMRLSDEVDAEWAEDQPS